MWHWNVTEDCWNKFSFTKTIVMKSKQPLLAVVAQLLPNHYYLLVYVIVVDVTTLVVNPAIACSCLATRFTNNPTLVVVVNNK